MRFKQSKVTALASGVALGVAALAAQASGEQSVLNTAGASSGATFRGGATINGGVSYLAEVPASEPADLLVNVTPASEDVGKMADIYVVLNAGELGLFQKLSGGIWLQLDLNDLSNLQPYTSKVLGESAQITVIERLRGDNVNLGDCPPCRWRP